MQDTPAVVVRNQSTALTTIEAWNIAWALGYQVRWQMGPLWMLAADVTLMPTAQPVPAGAWILDLLDTEEEEGALGHHDEDGNEVPFGMIGVKTAKENGVSPSEVASHEFMEMLVNPHVNATVFDSFTGRLYPREVCDAAQGGAYDLGAPYNRVTGMVVSDFVLPEWFDEKTPLVKATSYRGVCSGPFGLGVGGYVNFTTTIPPSWEQQFGEKADKTRAALDRRIARFPTKK